MESDDELFFVGRDVPSLNSGPQVVEPPEAATLGAPVQPCKRRVGKTIIRVCATELGFLSPAFLGRLLHRPRPWAEM